MCLSLTERFHVLIVLFFLHTCKLVQLLCIAYIKELLVLPKMAQGFLRFKLKFKNGYCCCK